MKKLSLRKATWQGDAAGSGDVAEHLRDIAAVVGEIVPMRLVRFANIAYQPPLTVESSAKPEAVLCIRAEDPAGNVVFPGNQTTWTWNGSTIKVTLSNVTSGTRLGALKLLVIG